MSYQNILFKYKLRGFFLHSNEAFSILNLALLSSFADISPDIINIKASAVLGLMKCEVAQAKNGIEICDIEIENALEARISPEFIFKIINDRNLDLPEKVNGKLTNWFWVKAAVALN